MPVRALTCYIAVCDLCGQTSDNSEYGLHADTPEEAIQHATDNTYDDRRGWTLTLDGLLVCDMNTDTAHEDAHAGAGKRMSGCAMTVTFPLKAWTCRFCSAENDDAFRRCLSCGHLEEESRQLVHAVAQPPSIA